MFKFLKLYISWIKVEQLTILGVKTDHIYFMIVFLTIFFIYLLIKPMLTWFTKRNYMTILSYFASSLIVLIIAYILLHMTDHFNIDLIKLVMYAIVLFGIYLAVLVTYNLLKKEF